MDEAKSEAECKLIEGEEKEGRSTAKWSITEGGEEDEKKASIQEDWLTEVKAKMVGDRIIDEAATLVRVSAESVNFPEKKVQRGAGERRIEFLKATGTDGTVHHFLVKQQTHAERGAKEYEIGMVLADIFNLRHLIVAPLCQITSSTSHTIVFDFIHNAQTLGDLEPGQLTDAELLGGLDSMLQVLEPFDPHILSTNRFTNNDMGPSQIVITPEKKFFMGDFGSAILQYQSTTNMIYLLVRQVIMGTTLWKRWWRCLVKRRRLRLKANCGFW